MLFMSIQFIVSNLSLFYMGLSLIHSSIQYIILLIYLILYNMKVASFALRQKMNLVAKSDLNHFGSHIYLGIRVI